MKFVSLTIKWESYRTQDPSHNKFPISQGIFNDKRLQII
jgi:hypothetical protein